MARPPGGALTSRKVIRTLLYQALLIVPLLLLAVGCGPSNSGGSSNGGSSTDSGGLSRPSDDEVRATIKKTFGDIYGVDSFAAKFDHIVFHIGAISVGGLTQKAVGAGVPQPVYPVKVQVDMDIYYSNNSEIDHHRRGDKPDDVFFFYKDTFGAWQFKTGSL